MTGSGAAFRIIWAALAASGWLLVPAGCGRLGYQPMPDDRDSASAQVEDAGQRAPDMARSLDAPGVGSGADAASTDAILPDRPGDSAAGAIMDSPGPMDSPGIQTDAAAGEAGAAVDVASGDAPPAVADAAPAPPALALSVGYEHACLLREGGTLWCWGRNPDGELGVNDTMDRLRPTPVAGNARWQAVAAGRGRTCAIDSWGRLHCWGDNPSGQLGTGTTPRHLVPAPVTTRTDWRSVRVGWYTFFAEDDAGGIHTWGLNAENQTSLSSPSSVTTPTRVLTGRDVIAVAPAEGHTCAIVRAGTLWCWGRNTDGQCGRPATTQRVTTPTQVGTETDWASVSTGPAHTCGIRRDGTLFCFGNTFHLGGAAGSGPLPTPQRVGTFADWMEVAAGFLHSCGIRRDGTLWCWGRNVEGQLGTGDTLESRAPVQEATRATDWTAVGVGATSGCALKRDGSVWCTGANAEGMLGLGDQSRRYVFTRQP